MELDDPRWGTLEGAYRVPYDPRPALSNLERGRDTAAAWQELWNELYHQGDVGDSSYAAVPHLVRIYENSRTSATNTYMLIAMIEGARRAGRDLLPAFLEEAYHRAWQRLFLLVVRELPEAADHDTSSAMIAIVALEKQQPALANLALRLNDSERVELLARSGWID
ncbi:hypothetical protein IVA79_11935 [Bradyrhizobium sp. 138]|uniref:hypothetical protein n=1 Tax=Bradyrhizobium sp. 138 TaxID=2782615 RepID=UPI001FFB8FCB|nr:hypothetical protein [Bradyrhizobium sp. 138]MCK1734650.1 hypothetical protein [Bradyrhizobium sp. 138]